MTVKFIENNKWVEFDSLASIYRLFVQNGIDIMAVQPRTADITLEDGTIITQEKAIEGLLTIAIQNHLDREAQSHGYDSIHTASIRAGYTGPFQAEGVKFAQWMDACWTIGIQALADYKANSTPIPTEAELIATLPTLIL